MEMGLRIWRAEYCRGLAESVGFDELDDDMIVMNGLYDISDE